MRLVFALVLFVFLLPGQSSTVPTRRECDCHVYAVDIESGQKLVKLWEDNPDLTPEKLKEMAGDVERRLGEFKAEIGEERLTTQSYPFPGQDVMVSVSVFFTDEGMVSSDSMTLAILVGPVAVGNASWEPGAAITEISVDRHTFKVLTKQKLMMKDRLWVVGLECQLMTWEQRKQYLQNEHAKTKAQNP